MALDAKLLIFLLLFILFFFLCLNIIRIKMKKMNNDFYYKLYLKHKTILKQETPNSKDIKKNFYETLELYNNYKKDFEELLHESFNEQKFENYFIKNYKIKNNDNSHLYKFIINTLDKNKLSLNKYTKIDFINIIGKFLEIYPNLEKYTNYDINFIIKNIDDNCFISEKLFKHNLILLSCLGNKLIINYNNKIDIISNFNYFNEILLKIYNDIKTFEDDVIYQYLYPKNYNWTIYIKHYMIILCQKLYLDYKILQNVNKIYLDEIFKYIPNLGFSKKVLRFGINAHCINIRFLIAKIIQYQNDYVNINIFLYRNYKNLQINFINTNTDIIFYPDSGIICNNSINYNSITKLLFPYFLYYLLFNEHVLFKLNFQFLLRSIYKINSKLVTPVFLNPHDNTSFLYNTVSRMFQIAKYFNVFKNNYYFKAIIEQKHKYNKIEYIKSINVLYVNFNQWSIQLKLPSKYIYGSMDERYNFLNNILMSKIIMFDNILFDRFKKNIIYPGILFYKNHNVYSGPYYFTKFTNICHKDINYFISFSKIFSQEMNIIYNEMVFITPYGIIVGYFNIIKLLDEKLYLCYNSPIYDNLIDADMLYNDMVSSNTSSNISTYNIFYVSTEDVVSYKNSEYYTTVQSNILYYNFFYKTIIKLNRLLIDFYDILHIDMDIDNKNFKIDINCIDNTINLNKSKLS